MRFSIVFVTLAVFALVSGAAAQNATRGAHDALIAKHAAANGVPEALIRRVIARESEGNPRLVRKGNYGLMQIRLGTARELGYTGSPIRPARSRYQPDLCGEIPGWSLSRGGRQ